MKMIDVLNMMKEGRIKEGTKLKIGYKIYDYIKDYTENENCSFVNKEDDRTELLEDNELITTDFLNKEVELMPSKEKKYLIKINIKGLIRELTVVNYQRLIGEIVLGSPGDTNFVQTSFTKSEMQSIEPIREFLADMKGNYELIDVNSNDSMDSIKCNSTNIATNEEHTFTF